MSLLINFTASYGAWRASTKDKALKLSFFFSTYGYKSIWVVNVIRLLNHLPSSSIVLWGRRLQEYALPQPLEEILAVTNHDTLNYTYHF